MFAPFRYPAFRAIWIANLWSSLGATIQSVGAAWMIDSEGSHVPAGTSSSRKP